jgi:thiol-disulfide isomerase/thioredoxin
MKLVVCGFSRTRLWITLLAVAIALAPRAALAENFKPFKLKTLEGAERSLSQILGSKATLVAFFFPTCQYCNAAFPLVQKIYDANKDRGLSMVWINVMPDEQRLIADWRARHGYTAPVLLGGISTVEAYDLRMTPTHVLLDARGKVLWKHAGYKPGDEREIDRRIQQALAKG